MLSVYFASKGRSSSVSQMQDYIEVRNCVGKQSWRQTKGCLVRNHLTNKTVVWIMHVCYEHRDESKR